MRLLFAQISCHDINLHLSIFLVSQAFTTTLLFSPTHFFFRSPTRASQSNSPAAQQNSEATAPTAGGAGQRTAKEQPSRRRDEAKQAAKKPKENALSQFDLNNYASK